MTLPLVASALLLTAAHTGVDQVPVGVSTAWISAQIAANQDSVAAAPQSTPSPEQTPPPVPAAPSPPLSLSPPDATSVQTSPNATQASQSGDIVVTARPPLPGDPMEKLNAASFAATQAVDKAVVGPVSMTFKRIVPTPVRAGLSNFIYNVNEVDVFLNFMLQHKIGKAAETLGRFVINSTIGVFGLFDIAKRKPFHLPRRPNGFADTFGFYGIGPGPYIFLPIIGASTVRDLIGLNLDRLVMPIAVGKPFNKPYYTIPINAANILDSRSQFDAQLKAIRASSDPYAMRRDLYLRDRQAEIDHLRGKDRPATSIKTTPPPASLPVSATPMPTPELAPKPANR